MALFIPTYFSPISQYGAIINSKEEIVFETEDNFQKQTFRTRCYIYGANGKQLLNIPVKHKHTVGRKKTKETLIENDFPWQGQHFKSLQAAYRSSPFFEFFEDDLAILFNKKYKYLLDVNLDSYLFISDALDVSQKFSRTSSYEINPDIKDFRTLDNAKTNHPIELAHYTQVFDDKHGFIPNLSILDLLFMEGGNTFSLLEKISINF